MLNQSSPPIAVSLPPDACMIEAQYIAAYFSVIYSDHLTGLTAMK